MLIAADYPFLEIVGTMIIFFAWICWIWIVVTVLMDLFRRHDISGWGKAAWVVLVIIVSVHRRALLPGRAGPPHGRA